MRAEIQKSTCRKNCYRKIMILERAVTDSYVHDPDPYVLTWEATVNGKKRSFVSYKSSTEGASLRYCHRSIDAFLRNSYVSSDASFAYKNGSSIQSCLNRHLHSDVFLKTDIHSFFTTIEKQRMEKKLEKVVLRRNKKKLCKVIVDSCYYMNKMPLGFITSPILSDIYLAELDKAFEKRTDIVYTRYADDFIISSSGVDAECVLQKVLDEIRDQLSQLGLELNSKKTYVRRLRQSGDAIHLLGLNVVKTDTDSNRITVSDSYIRETSKELCYLINNETALTHEDLEQAFVSVYGKIQFIENSSISSANKLKKMLSVKLNRNIELDYHSLHSLL